MSAVGLFMVIPFLGFVFGIFENIFKFESIFYMQFTISSPHHFRTLRTTYGVYDIICMVKERA